MHIPPYHHKTTWQRFFAGMFIGALIGYCLFTYMHNTMYQRMLEYNLELKSHVQELKEHNEALLEDKKDLDKKNQEALTVETIKINIANDKSLKLSHLIVYQMEEMIKKEIKHIIGKDVEAISESDDLLTHTIENKKFTFEDLNYHFEVEQLTIAKTVKVVVKAEAGEQT